MAETLSQRGTGTVGESAMISDDHEMMIMLSRMSSFH